MKNQAYRIRIIFFGGLLISWLGSAQAAFEQERPGARPSGIGGAYCAVADDADTMNYNPAGLMLVRHSVLSFNYVRLLPGLDDGSLTDSRFAYLQPVDKVGSFGFSWYQRNLAMLYQENIFALGYGMPLDEKGDYLAGGTVKLLQQVYQDTQAINQNPYFTDKTSVVGLGLDLGAIARISETLRVGLSVANLNQPNMSLGGGESLVPFKLRMGGAYQNETFLGSVEAAFFDQHYRLSAGGEAWWFNDVIATRLGFGAGDQELSELTMGLSLRLQQPMWIGQIDYAFVNPLGGFSGAGGSHQFNFTINFGVGFESEESVHAKELVQRGDRAKAAGNYETALEYWEEAAEVLENDEALVTKIIAIRKTIRRSNEVEMLVKRGMEYEQNENYLNAAVSYRKALAMWPGHPQATRLLKQVEDKVRTMSQRQKELQEEREKSLALRAEQQNTKRAYQAIEKAEDTLDRVKKNAASNQLFPKDIRQLEGQLREAKGLVSKNESDQALVLAQDIVTMGFRLEQRIFRAEQREKRARQEKKASERAAPTPAAASVEAVPAKAASVAEPAEGADKAKSLKRARGAYGRLVKLMLDIDQLNGQKYFPNKIEIFRNELAKIKGLLENDEFFATIEDADKLYPALQKVKADCETKEKARKAMPTNW